MPAENLSGKAIGPYRLLKRIGEGGTATVYRAEHEDGRKCAVKILKERLRRDETAVKRFLREAGYGGRVKHPSVVSTFEYGESDGLYYLALEWADGVPLSEHLKNNGKLEPEVVASVINQLAGALAVAHAEGIIHRDLKPDNIMYDAETQTAKLLDFGIARDAQADPTERLTRAGFFVGTLQYVAPEALSGELVEEAADIYSLAKIAYHMLSNANPHDGISPRELFQQLLTKDPLPLNQAVKGLRFSNEVEDVIMRGLSREPQKRQKTVEQFASELAAAVENSPEPTDGLLGSLKGFFGRKK